MTSGYYRFPTIYNDRVVFVSEDDLWSVPAEGGVARRLTSNLGEVSHPSFSPDGTQLAFVGCEEGQDEIYLMPSMGGPARRLTYMGASQCLTAGWTRDGQIVFASNAGHWCNRFTHLYKVDREGNPPRQLNYGLARAIAFGPHGGLLLGRSSDDRDYWKRYRGGTIGQLWIDESGEGIFRPLLPDLGNLSSPMWLGASGDAGRIYFISDHEGVGNLYSCLPGGEDVRRHTRHQDFYARYASTDGRRIVYHAGADLYLYDPAEDRTRLIEVAYYSPRIQRSRKFVDAAGYLESWSIHPGGQALAITSRGKLFTFPNWEGPVIQLGETENGAPAGENATGIRYRLPGWLPDGQRLIAVADAGGEETFVIFHAWDVSVKPELLPAMDIGRPMAMAVNPKKDQIVFSNNRYELLFLDLATRQLSKIDRGAGFKIAGFDWSPDGEWVAYSVSLSLQVVALKLWHVASGDITLLAEPVLWDEAPAFDPGGKYLYFISYRTFDPVIDNLQLELSFPHGEKPYLITLQKDLTSPFIPKPRIDFVGKAGQEAEQPPDTDPAKSAQAEPEPGKGREESQQGEGTTDQAPKESGRLQIDLEGIQERLVAFPVPEGRYGRVLGILDGKVLYSRYPVKSALHQHPLSGEPEKNGTLYFYNFEEQREESLVSGITGFDLSADAKTLVYRAGYRLRVLKAGEKPSNENNGPNRKTGWVDLGRVKVSVEPGAEWRQMYREAWRLQRDQFWTEDMSQVDWLAIHDRYLPLVDRVGSRAEFSDLMWEMQGELGTSHAFESGGDYRPQPRYTQGRLGAEFEYDPESDGWRITHIYHGDVWDPDSDSPFHQPGINVQVGDRLLAINGRRLGRPYTPDMALVNQAGEEVTLTILPRSSESDPPVVRTMIVQTLRSETQARYRAWVEANRQRVHQASGGSIGYVHIPDMKAQGYAEFHRGFLVEAERDGLIVDVRFNLGGNVSELILERLARRRIAYMQSRWQQQPVPYPRHAIAGPVLALTNEYAASDGDIFSHGFKLMKLGPLVGKRTWGGVIGYHPTHGLADGTRTTQPEFSFWFSDVGWEVENRGTEPDIEVDILPQDYARGMDSQLERAIQEILKLLEAKPPALPDLSQRPSKAAPKLPKEL